MKLKKAIDYIRLRDFYSGILVKNLGNSSEVHKSAIETLIVCNSFLLYLQGLVYEASLRALKDRKN